MFFSRDKLNALRRSKRFTKGYYFLFSILLWVHLVLGAGLVLWRYKLVLFDNWNVYVSNYPPDLDQFILFTQQECPEEAVIAYIATPQFDGFSLMRYTLYPRPVIPIVFGTGRVNYPSVQFDGTVGLGSIADEFDITCFAIDDVPFDFLSEMPITWKKLAFSEERYLLVSEN